ncbi:hypothetical protein ILUMI_20153, partial [Ignelater luminosus]
SNEPLTKEIKCGRTKSTALTKECIAKQQLNEITEKLKENVFSIIIDETTDISTEKSLALVVRFFDCDQWKDKFLGLLKVKSCSAEDLFDVICKYLNSLSVLMENIIGFAADNASVMMGNITGHQKVRKTNRIPEVCGAETSQTITSMPNKMAFSSGCCWPGSGELGCLKAILLRALEFYIELSQQIKSRFNFEDPVLFFVSNSNPKIALSGNINSIAVESVSLFPNLVDDLENLNSEWRLLAGLNELKQYEEKSSWDAELKEYWQKRRRVQLPDSTPSVPRPSGNSRTEPNRKGGSISKRTMTATSGMNNSGFSQSALLRATNDI